ncbi:glycine--tRNA ligase [Candidatus Roizmanbacteria bacterium]|nr:glycine--tRNA ligase [Candidatus Roizmanbacteria bacterium]
MSDHFSTITSLAKRRGFVYPGSEIYGGLANTYDYGPLGVELLRNIKNLWWDHFVTKRQDMFGLDTNILMNPKVWEASGHAASFTDAVVDCRSCQFRTRADHLIEDYLDKHNPDQIDSSSTYNTNRLSEEKMKTLIKTHKVEGYSPEELDEVINAFNIPCTNCDGNTGNKWTPTRKFNLLFETHIGIVSEDKSLAYLRGEIAQGMFVNFKNVLDTLSPKLAFGLAQSGAAFRNEITPGKFTFRTLQFNLAEFEYFFNPKEDWNKQFEYWKEEMWKWSTEILKLKPENLRWRPHTDEERSHYSKRTEDIEYNYPFGFKELYGLAYRTDFDLKNHMEKSGVDLRYTDQQTGEKFIPHVMEPTFGMDRTLLAILFDSYHEEEIEGKKRVVLQLPKHLAPYKVAVFPLVRNKEEITKKAREVFDLLKQTAATVWDDRGNIGKRYFAQDEIGTPFCITIDYDTLEDNTVTVRDRDTMKQERVKIEKLIESIT